MRGQVLLSWVTDDITLWRGKLLLKVIQDVSGGWAGFNFVVGISVLKHLANSTICLWFKKILPI